MSAESMLALILLLAALVPLSSRGDEVRIGRASRNSNGANKTPASDNKEAARRSPPTSATPLAPDDKAEVVRAFFEFEGINLDPLEAEQLGRYDVESVASMRQVLANKDNFLQAFLVNAKVNSQLYANARRLVESGEAPVEAPLERHDEALLLALDLIVPNSSDQVDYERPKRDLRDFCHEQLARCRELLERLAARLNARQLHTMDAMQTLDGFYYNWIPLGRLTQHLEQLAEPQAVSS